MGVYRGYRNVVSEGPVGGNRQVTIKGQRYQPRSCLNYREFSFLDGGPVRVFETGVAYVRFG